VATAAEPRQIGFPGILIAKAVPGSPKPPKPKVRPRGDRRLRQPGWAGDLAPDELAFLEDRLERDQRLAVKWAFPPGAKPRPEGVIRRVAMHGDPDNRRLNLKLARQARAEIAQDDAKNRAPKPRRKTGGRGAKYRATESVRQLVLL
jgi:hypothetical protein